MIHIRLHRYLKQKLIYIFNTSVKIGIVELDNSPYVEDQNFPSTESEKDKSNLQNMEMQFTSATI